MFIGDGVAIGIKNIETNCPICGATAPVSEGIFKSTKDTIELISGPDSTRAMLESLKLLAEKLSAGQIDRAEAIKQAAELSPTYAAAFEIFIKLGLPALALLITIIGTYLQFAGNKSSSEDAKKLLNAITEQTFAIKEIGNEHGVISHSKYPSGKKSDSNMTPTKGPSCRRANVRKERRAAIKKFRQSFGQSRTR
jgi:hypothetical protein